MLRFPYCLNRTVFVFVCIMGIVANYNKFSESSDEITNVVDNILACFNSSVVILFNVSLDFELISLLILQRDTNFFLLNFLINLRFFFFFLFFSFFFFLFFTYFPLFILRVCKDFISFFFSLLWQLSPGGNWQQIIFDFSLVLPIVAFVYFSDHLVSLLF